MPAYEEIMLPFLQSPANGDDYALSDLIVSMAQMFNLRPDENRSGVKSGR
jgi:restriction endonuclease Mrr